MRKQQLPKVPGVKNWTGMNIISSIMYHSEALKIESDHKKREILQNRLANLRLELRVHQAA